ncbi:hypothetical protein [Polaribacter sargassicola]|uniref:hypothetical protein n=1 Tax=Polaribacter sargassicola TaxID=2836891 RepID=UPI001F21A8B5|nr:hypothetical protein [Polaribacter sp. DS7-9]MCG1037598.1 hypothetical protein [Polaribacter sp. DS7-9]
MKIKELKKIKELENNKLVNKHLQLKDLLTLLEKRELNTDVINTINTEVDKVNAVSNLEKELKNQIIKSQSNIINLIEKEHKLVAKNHYRKTWMAIGMAAFGLPMGVIFGSLMNNMAFMGIGLPIGMVIGLAVGTNMDKKAFDEGRQLNLEIKY